MRTVRSKILATLLLVAALGLGWLIWVRLPGDDAGGDGRGRGTATAAPVEVARIQQGAISLQRVFSGSLEATESFVVATRVGGRVEQLPVDLADLVAKGDLLARLDDDENQQRIAQVEADLAVAQANLAEAEVALEIARRALKRTRELRERGIESETRIEAAESFELARGAALEVARSYVTRAEAALTAETIRSGYTRVTADWPGEDTQRIVAERFVDEGETVTANQPLLSIIKLDPITGAVFVPERDYSRIEPGQQVTCTTDAYPDEVFLGRVTRIAPVFQQATRQARVELTLPNASRRLKPGMFVHVTIELGAAADATIVPVAALTRRGDRDGVFVLSDGESTVRWCPVRVGIHDADRVQVTGEGLAGRVVILGHQLIDDGSAVLVPSDSASVESPASDTAAETNPERTAR